MPDSDDPDFKYRLYEVTGASHDTQWSYVDYYQDDEDLKRIDHLPVYVGKHAEANAYPSQYLFHAAFRNLFRWVRTGAAPATCPRIELDANGENVKDALGNTKGGLRTCLLEHPFARYSNTSLVEPGQGTVDKTSDKDGLFGIWSRFRHRCSRSCTDRSKTIALCVSAIRRSRCHKVLFVPRMPKRSLTLP